MSETGSTDGDDCITIWNIPMNHVPNDKSELLTPYSFQWFFPQLANWDLSFKSNFAAPWCYHHVYASLKGHIYQK